MREKILYEIIRRTVPFLPLLHRSHPVLYNTATCNPTGHKPRPHNIYPSLAAAKQAGAATITPSWVTGNGF